MFKRDEFLVTQKILRIATIDPNGYPHVVPVWYMYNSGKFYIGTNTRTKKAINLKKNKHVSFCVDVGITSPKIQGITGYGTGNLILNKNRVSNIAKKILIRYFKSLDSKSAQDLLHQTDCVIEIIPEKFTKWNY